MANYRLDLEVLNPKGKGFAGPLSAHIYIRHYSKKENGTIYISPECVSLSEIEHACDSLIKEIEYIRKKAQKQFKIK
jgi:hypothetical protein